MRSIRLPLILMFAVLGCTRGPEISVQRWSRNDSGQMPARIASVLPELVNGKSIQLNREQKIVRVHQRIAGVVVEDTSAQVLMNASGEIEYAALAYLDSVPGEWEKSLGKLQSQRPAILKKWRMGPGRRWANLPTEVEVLIAKRAAQNFVPALRIRVVDEVEGQLRDFLYFENGQLGDERLIRMSGVDGVGRVFLGPPDRSRLEDEILQALLGDGTLTGAYVRLLSADGKGPLRPNNDFRFNPGQREFDDVQAYFFADQHSRWFGSVLDFRLPSKLELKLHVGAPIPGNAMFYYANQVRLGDGDGVSYRGIPRDPSIVKHEVSHAFVEALSGLGFEGEAGSYSEAFADVFAALADNEPLMGGYAFLEAAGRRSLANELKANKALGEGKYESSLVISGTFWDLKETFGAETAARLAKAFLIRLGPSGRFQDFVPVFTDAIKTELGPQQQAIALSVIERRGWKAE